MLSRRSWKPLVWAGVAVAILLCLGLLIPNLARAQAIEEQIQILKDKDGVYTDGDYEKAVAALVEIGSPAVEPLIELLNDESTFSGPENAAKALGLIGDERAIGPLVAALERLETEVIPEAGADNEIPGYSLTDDDEEEAISEQPPEQRQVGLPENRKNEAINALVKIGPPAVQPLVDALKDENLREYAVRALGMIKDKGAVEPLIAVLEDKESTGQAEAAKALGSFGDQRAIDPLIGALDDSSYGSYETSLASEEAYKALVRIGAPAVEQLIAALSDEGAQELAAQALGEIGDERAVAPLIAALRKVEQGDMGDYTPNEDALETALGRMGYPAVGPLIAMLNEPAHSEQATVALARIGKPAVDALISRLQSDYSSMIVTTLIKIGNDAAIQPMIATLNSVGTEAMAEDFLNCGNEDLENAARSWAENHGYVVSSIEGSPNVTWGSSN
ncbi:MAG: HEAT repeat domain-containing protein [Candidatus Aquicultorales bacterium]